MSTHANGAAPPDHPPVQDMMAQDIDIHTSSPDAIMTDADVDPDVDPDTSTPMGLRSPPDSDKALNPDEASDSELSDLDDDVADKLDQDLTFDLDLTTNLSDSKTANQHKSEPTVSHEHDKPATAATVENITQIKEEQEGERKQQSQQPEPGAASANTPMSPTEEDIGEILPDRFENNVPVFKPTMKQFQDFKLFMEKVDKYGMKSGIIKIVPPDEWKNSLPPLDKLVKQVRVREPIKQEIMGQNGTYRQVNILHQRSYNLPQWRKLCDQSEHQPPARRGERRANAEKDKPAARSRAAANATTSNKTTTSTHSGRGGRRKGRVTRGSAKASTDETDDPPITPVSPPPEEEDKPVKSIEEDNEEGCEEEESAPKVGRMGFSRQSKPKMQSTSARRKYIRREGSAMIDEAAFKDWDYRMDVSEFTPERCEELERIYWKTLTYAPPLYGADLPGTLFDESTENWNLNKLPNLLDVLGTKVPGVNTAYLYLGMWKATFAWHLEDVDLYSINFLHFGAPKQWYSISQADARRFEAAMKNIWPTDAKACDQFLRHKSFLISPSHLKQHYGITVNKVVSYPGEFVVTYPYGYHSGYNLGYNCAEAVNFALDSWLPMGKIAKKCQCAQAQDSVWVDVYEIERKLRGESTEYEVTEDEDEEDEDSDESDQDTGLPSPPSGLDQRGGKRVRTAGQKRKREATIKGGQGKAKRSRYRLKAPVEPPCCLCPNDIPGAEIMPTDDGRKAHRMCALYLPETYIETVDDQEIIANVAGIDKARLELKCLYCRSKKGACFQCSQKKCPRAYHATCAAAAGVFVEEGDVPVIGEDGTEYKEQAFEFSCRFHRVKRDRKTEGAVLEDDPVVRKTAESLKKNDICQIQYYQGNIFAGVVVENMPDEETLLLDVIPSGDRILVEWKWLLVADPSEYRLPKASANAIPMPTSKKAKQEINAKRPVEEIPRKGDELCDGFVWAEFHTGEPDRNKEQVKIDLTKENQVWHYLGSTSTEARAQYTENPSRKQHNSKSNFLDTIPKPPPAYQAPVAVAPRKSISAPYPTQQQTFAVSPASSSSMASTSLASKQDKPYVYKPRKPVQPQTQFNVQYTSHMFMPAPPLPSPSYMPQQSHPFYQAQPRPNVPQTVHPSQVFSPHQQHQPMQFDNQRRMSQPIQPFHQQQMSPQHFTPQHQMPQQMPQHQFQPQHQPQQHQFQHFQPPAPAPQQQQQQQQQQQHHYQPQQPPQQQHHHYTPSNYPQTPVPLPPQAFQFQQQTPVPLPQQAHAQPAQPPQQKSTPPLPPPVQAQPQPPQQQHQVQQQAQQPVQPIRQTPVPVPQVPLPPPRSTQSPPQQQQPPQQAQDEKAQKPQSTADEARPASPPQPLPKPKPFKVYKASQFRKLKLPEKKPGGKKELPDAFASSRFSFAGIDRIHELPGCQWPPKISTSGPEIQYRPQVWSPLGDEGPKPAPMTSSLLKRSEDEQRPLMKYDFFRQFNNRDPLKHISPYKPAVTELDETTGKQRLVHAEFTEYYAANVTKLVKNAQEILTRKDESEPNSRPATSHAHSRNTSSASVQQKESQPQQSSVTGQAAQQPTVQPQYNYNQHEAGFGGSPFSSHSVPGPVMVGQAFVQQPGSHQQQYQGPWQQQYQNQGSHNTWMGSPQMVGSPQPQMFSPQPAQQGHHHHLPQQSQQQQQNAQNQQPPPPQPAKPQFTKQSHSPIPLPPYVQKMAQAKPSPLSQPPQTAQSQPQKKRQRKTAQQASGQTISPNQLSVNTGAGSSTQGQPQKAQSNNPWTNANNVNLQFPTVSSQPPAPTAAPAAPAQPQSQTASSDKAPAADASTQQDQDPVEEEPQHEETSYFNEAQVEGLQTPPLQPQSLSSTEVSPDQSYFPSLSAPPPTPLTGIQNHNNFAFSTSMLGPIGTTFNPASAFNINALSVGSGVGGLGALGTLGGLLGGIESGASANATWSGRARGLSRSGDNVFMGSTSVIDEEGEETGRQVGGGGGSGSGGQGGGGGGGLSSHDMLEKIFSNLHRLGGD